MALINPISYFKESKAELGKVIWPTRRETVRLTLITILISVVVGLYIAGIDTVLSQIAERFLR